MKFQVHLGHLALKASDHERIATARLCLAFCAPCGRTGPEERAGPSVVSLVRSLVSECPVAAPVGSERMEFRVGRSLWPSVAPRETWEWR